MDKTDLLDLQSGNPLSDLLVLERILAEELVVRREMWRRGSSSARKNRDLAPRLLLGNTASDAHSRQLSFSFRNLQFLEPVLWSFARRLAGRLDVLEKC